MAYCGHLMRTCRIGVISDTHGLLRADVNACLSGVSHIIHAGDIGRREVVTSLKRIAPVTAVRGNVDSGRWAEEYPYTQTITIAGRSIHALHDLNDLQLNPMLAGMDVVIAGHSHRSRVETRQSVLYLNPGSAGPRRFKLPVTMATLDLTQDGMEPRIHRIL
jgi:uncharacterized protein